MRSRRAVVAGLLALVAIAAVVAVVVVRHSSGIGRGPLDVGFDPDEGAAGVAMTLDLGTSAALSGPWNIRNTSEHQHTLDRVRAIGLSQGMKFVGAYVMPVGTLGAHGGQIGWAGFRVPPNGSSLPGATIGPHAQLQLVVGLRPTRRGRHTVKGFDVLYHDGSASYRRRAAYEIAVCAPNNVKPCNDPLWSSG
jgi:hypothetical protein